MNDQIFLDYYEDPIRQLSRKEHWEVHQIFPTEAAITEDGKEFALEALYRFSKAGLCEYHPDTLPYLDVLKELKEAPLNHPPYPDEYGMAWMGNLINGTEKLFSMREALEIPEEWSETRLPYSFREKLSHIFTAAGVGFEKENILPF